MRDMRGVEIDGMKLALRIGSGQYESGKPAAAAKIAIGKRMLYVGRLEAVNRSRQRQMLWRLFRIKSIRVRNIDNIAPAPLTHCVCSQRVQNSFALFNPSTRIA